MAQRSQVIDITKSYLPGDPNSFVQSLVNTDREDGEEKTLPVLPYEGYNFLPTSYGYRSYFGVNTILDVGILSSQVQFILSYQLADYTTKLIALTEDGIWSLDANTASAAWVHEITLAYTPNVFAEWTWCVIENILYMYQQGGTVAYKTSEAAGVLSIATHTPSFLTMTGQMGIFKAGLRLGFWDSANSVSWSSNLDLTDFIPSIENMAGNTTFGDTIGRIITIRQHGEGFVVYCTKATVGVSRDLAGNMLWDSKKIFDNIGISYSRAVTYGQSDNEHFVWSTNGFYHIGKYNALSGKHEVETLVPDVYDFLRESRDPIYLDTVNSRFIFFHIVDPDYVYGLTSFQYVTPEDLNVRFLIGGYPWDGEDLPAICMDGNAAAEAFYQLVTFGFVSAKDNTAIWTPITVETQGDAIGPLDETGTRNAEDLGFTTADIVSIYITGSTLPGELDPIEEEHTDVVTEYLGAAPFGSVISGIGSETLAQLIYKQHADWELFKVHQDKAFAAVAAATKTTVTEEGTVIYYLGATGSLPALPAPVTVDVEIGTFRTGRGNVELQKDVPLLQLRLRKYFQEGKTITKRTVTTKTWRAGTPVTGKRLANTTGGYLFDSTPPPTPPASTTLYSYTDGSAGYQARLAALQITAWDAFWPSVLTNNTGTWNKYSSTINNVTGNGNVYWGTPGNVKEQTQSNGSFSDQTVTPYYYDSTEVITYIVGDAVAQDMGYADFKATQVSYAHTIIQVTSDPPTVVVHTETPIFPTGPSAVTFFPPAWEGEETLTIIAASALSPWHHIDGTFGIDVVGDPITETIDTQLTSLGGCDLYGDPFIGADYGLTYSSFPYVLQVGSPNLYYPTFAGALVLDLQLKKWGKQKNDYQVVIDLQPINQFNHTILTNPDRGMDAALQLVDTTIKIFDEEPADSWLTWGKIGGYRLGMTDILEVKAYNRRPCTGSLLVDSSMDGRTIDTSLRYTLAYGSAQVIEAYPDISARWHVITMSGIFDLTGLEARTTIVSRR